MITFPNAKINLGLNIVEKRVDGFHNLETIFLPISVCDIIEIIENSNGESDIEFSSTGLAVDADVNNNLCVKAYQLLKKDFKLPKVKMHLHKQIPMGAGLGGGSANAAFVLKLLNQKFELNISNDALINYALLLGSDCPFFVSNKPCFATGRGEILEEISIDLSKYKLLIINPQIHISTAQAFANIIPNQPKYSLKEIIKLPISNWKDMLKNDFENSVFSMHQSIKNIKNILYKNDAVYASMTGTGSTVYGIFEQIDEELISQFATNYFCKWVDVIA